MYNDLLVGGAVENLLLTKTFTVSGNNLSADADQFIFVKMGATSPQVVAAAALDKVIGISQDTNINARTISVGLVGVSKLRLNATVEAGGRVSAAADGEGTPYLGLGSYGAIALEDGSANEVIEVLIHTGFASSA